jgi:hypothetical protein
MVFDFTCLAPPGHDLERHVSTTPADRAIGRRQIAEPIREPVGDRRVIGGGAGIGLGGERALRSVSVVAPPCRSSSASTTASSLASTTTVTSAWFLAAARIMAGPLHGLETGQRRIDVVEFAAVRRYRFQRRASIAQDF